MGGGERGTHLLSWHIRGALVHRAELLERLAHRLKVHHNLFVGGLGQALGGAAPAPAATACRPPPLPFQLRLALAFLLSELRVAAELLLALGLCALRSTKPPHSATPHQSSEADSVSRLGGQSTIESTVHSNTILGQDGA